LSFALATPSAAFRSASFEIGPPVSCFRSLASRERHVTSDRQTPSVHAAGDDAFAAASVLVACLLELPPQPVASAPTPAARAAATTTRRNRVIDGRSERSRPENGGGHTTRSVD
jgi:hypothetical protein